MKYKKSFHLEIINSIHTDKQYDAIEIGLNYTRNYTNTDIEYNIIFFDDINSDFICLLPDSYHDNKLLKSKNKKYEHNGYTYFKSEDTIYSVNINIINKIISINNSVHIKTKKEEIIIWISPKLKKIKLKSDMNFYVKNPFEVKNFKTLTKKIFYHIEYSF